MSRQAPGGLLKSSLQSPEMNLNSRPSGSLAQYGSMSMSKAVADFLVFDSGNLVATLNNPPRMEELLPGEIGYTPTLAASAPRAIPIHSDSSPALEVVDIPGKGKGIVALRDLAEGDLLFVEKPLATLEWDMDYVESELDADLTRQIEALGEEDRQAYYSLHIADPVKFDYRPAAIFRTNAIGLGGSRHLGGTFKLASRFNHSCSTSVLYEWDEKDQVLLLTVVRNVAKGEELTAPYLSSLLPSEERQAYLKKHYGFTCCCQVCSLPPKELAKSDDRRAEISRIRDLVAKPPKPDSIPLKHHALCLSALGLLEEEGLRLGLEVYLAYTAFMMSVIYGYRMTADIWIDHLLQLEKRAHGVYTSLYRLFKIFKEDPSRNPGWRFIQRLESKLGRLNSLR